MRTVAVRVAVALVAVAGAGLGPPDDCRFAAHLDFAALRRSEVWPRLAAPLHDFLGGELGLAGLLDGAGIRVETDLDALTVAICGDPPRTLLHTLMFARGRFDVAKVSAVLTGDGVFRGTERGGMQVFSSPRAWFAVAIVDGGLLYASPAAALDRVRDRPIPLLRGLIASSPPGFATAALRTTPAMHVGGPGGEGLTRADLLFTVGSPCRLSGRATAIDAQCAEKAVRGIQTALPAGSIDLHLDGSAISGSVTMGIEDATALLGIPIGSKERPGVSARPVVMDGGPALEGDGRMQCITVGGHVFAIAVSPDDRHVYVDRIHEPDLLLDAELRLVARFDRHFGKMGFALDGKSALWYGIDSVEIWSIPALQRLVHVPLEYGASFAGAVCPLPATRAFVLVNERGIRRFDTEPPDWAGEGKPAVRDPWAAAIDAATGMLLIVGLDTTLEIFDPVALTSVATLSLPFARITHRIVAAGGRVWVGGTDGTILPIDIARREMLAPVRVADRGDVHVALSSSGRTMAAFAQEFVDADHHPTVAKIYAVEGGALRERASASFVAPRGANAIGILESANAVLVAADVPLVWRYG